MIPKIADFGLSRIIEQTITYTARALGLPFCIAEELMVFLAYSFQADVFTSA